MTTEPWRPNGLQHETLNPDCHDLVILLEFLIFAVPNSTKMKKEFGKWLMDIAKYITTAVILSSFFGEADTVVMYAGGGLAVISTLAGGLYLLSDKSSARRNNNNH